jgi:hypothetical protein
VALSAPAEISVAGSPITTAGTLALTWASATANYFFAGPNGAPGTPSFRAMVAADVPTLNQNTTGSAGSVVAAATFNNGGAGDASGTTYNGATARTISYNTLGAQPTLVSATNIKTVNSTTLLGSGDLAVGTVTAVTGSSPIISSGGTAPNLTLGTIITSKGGTGVTSYTAGDLFYYASGSAFTKLAIGANNYVLTSSGTAPQWTANTGTGNVARASLPSFTTTIGVGGATASASGSGISFPSTQSASTDANTLDDYEEGTWTPSDGSGAGLSFSGVTATYTKIGRQVNLHLALQYPATASGANARVSGLPFATAAGIAGTAAPWTNAGLNFTVYSSGSDLLLSDNTMTNLTNTQMSSKYLYLTMTYPV